MLAGRKKATEGVISIDGTPANPKEITKLSSYCEQHDALLGVLTVRETVRFSARLSLMLQKNMSNDEIDRIAEETITQLGLGHVADNRVGTPIQRGLSGGQKRRLTLATSFVARPSILFLDEPVSGLDSATAYEVMAAIRRVAVKQNIAVIATIHSPNWQTFTLFDSVLLLAAGKTMYQGPPQDVARYFASLGHPSAEHENPADQMLSLVNGDFSSSEVDPLTTTNPSTTTTPAAAEHEKNLTSPVKGDTAAFARAWAERHPPRKGSVSTHHEPAAIESMTRHKDSHHSSGSPRHLLQATWLLSQRNMLNYSRNLLAYGVRFGMYIGL